MNKLKKVKSRKSGELNKAVKLVVMSAIVGGSFLFGFLARTLFSPALGPNTSYEQKTTKYSKGDCFFLIGKESKFQVKSIDEINGTIYYLTEYYFDEWNESNQNFNKVYLKADTVDYSSFSFETYNCNHFFYNKKRYIDKNSELIPGGGNKIKKYPDPILRQKSKPVKEITEEIKEQLENEET